MNDKTPDASGNNRGLLRSFDHLARIYQPLEALTFGGALQAARTACLDALDDADDVLLCGDGDGRFLAALLQRNQTCRATSIDGSEKMLDRAKRRIAEVAPDRLDVMQWVHADLRTVVLEQDRYDAVVAVFVLDCFAEASLRSLLGRIGTSLHSNGKLYVVDFAPPGPGWRGWRQRLWLCALYRAFELTTDIEAAALVDPRPILRELGFGPARSQAMAGGLLYATVYQRNVNPADPSRTR